MNQTTFMLASELSFLLLPLCYLAKWSSGPFHEWFRCPLSTDWLCTGTTDSLNQPILMNKVLQAFCPVLLNSDTNVNCSWDWSPSILGFSLTNTTQCAWSYRSALVFMIRTHGSEHAGWGFITTSCSPPASYRLLGSPHELWIMVPLSLKKGGLE